VLAGPLAAADGHDAVPQVSVREARGTYTVTARFEIPQSPADALAVLSDYERIPRFMPEIKTSVVLARSDGRILVEQEAISRFMMFSKKVHLLLEVTQDDTSLRFVDRCGKSFTTYQGAWRAATSGGRTTVTYELIATPAFDVPEFILKRLLKRDSVQMIERLQREIAAGR
jgi:ribosome-associated toxin RatA of RatAB toxin-antitoxin module